MKTKKLAFAGLLIAIGIILPQAFHVFGENIGMMFLPMHIPVFVAGILLGPYYGVAVGLIVPALNSVITGMPMVPKLYFMLFELAAYGAVSGILSRKANIFVTLLISMLSGRIIYGASLMIGVKLIGFQAPFANSAAFLEGIISGIPGIILQLVIIPVLIFPLRKGGFTFDGATKKGSEYIAGK